MSAEKHYRCIKEFSVPLCDEDGCAVESGETTPVEVGETFRRSTVTWMNDVRLEGVGNTYWWLEVSEETFKEYFEGGERMSKLYVVIQVCHETHNNYRMDEIRESFSVGLPFIFTDRDRAYREAEKKRKVHVPCFVKEFPYNPLDNRMEAMQKKMDADAEYIAHLEGVVKELEERLEERVNE